MQEKQDRIAVYVSLGVFILALLVMFYTQLHPTPEYEELEEVVVTVDSFRVVHHSKTPDDGIIRTTDGVKYYLRGTYSEEELIEKLVPGVEVTLKYHEGMAYYFIKMNYAKEVIIGNEVVCTYANYDEGNRVGMALAGNFLMVISFIIIFPWIKSRGK